MKALTLAVFLVAMRTDFFRRAGFAADEIALDVGRFAVTVGDHQAHHFSYRVGGSEVHDAAALWAARR